MGTTEVEVTTERISDMFEKMEPRGIALLVAKIMQPDRSLIDISNELWPDLVYTTRRLIISNARTTEALKMVRARPWIMAAVMGNKIAPVMVSVLYELALNPETKSNVRATAAKELIRLAQSTASQLVIADEGPLPVDEMDRLLEGNDTSELSDGLDDEVRIVDAAPLTLDQLNT